MSERKTSEIKLRVTPSFKAAVQLAAEQAGETMSVYIESASQDRIDVENVVGVKPRAITPEEIAGRFSTNTLIAKNPVPAKDADGSCEKNCHPWEWCECKQLRRD